MFVTSFSPQGFEKYGRRFLETFVANSDVPITVYYEGYQPDFIHELVHYRDLYEIPEMWNFIMKIKGHEVMRGISRKEDGTVVYNYRYDAFKFSRKVFAIYDAIKANPGTTVAWIDADMVVLGKIDMRFLEQFKIRRGVRIAFVGRVGWHSECGFMVFYDTDKRDTKAFLETYRNIYINGAFAYMVEWHDCYAFDVSRHIHDIKSNNIASSVPIDDEHQLHPMCHIPELAAVLDHLKGDRKEIGFSPEHPTQQLVEEHGVGSDE